MGYENLGHRSGDQRTKKGEGSSANIVRFHNTKETYWKGMTSHQTRNRVNPNDATGFYAIVNDQAATKSESTARENSLNREQIGIL